MGLRTKGGMMFDHTVADARFMYRAGHTETVAVGGSDVDAMVFRLADNASVACAGPAAVGEEVGAHRREATWGSNKEAQGEARSGSSGNGIFNGVLGAMGRW